MNDMPNCPYCASNRHVSLYGPSNHRYSAAFVCYTCDPYGRHFSADQLSGVERERADGAEGSARAMSKANAAAYRERP